MCVVKLTHNDYREAGTHLFEYFRELLARDGDKAEIKLHCDHMRSLLTFAPDEGN
jgi:hypothetical protein